MSIIASSNKTLSKDGTAKIDCAKECPCGIPTIPVPDKWLEVMVVGGFKVWHIVFIIIALIITIIVVYCCFHRCRIPRTKQEIEADLMRATLTNKFRDYLQEMTNEQITFMEALKKVQEVAEKLEEDDAMLARELGNRKRMGWLKLKGKGGQEKDPIPTNLIEASAEEIAKQQQLAQQQQQQQQQQESTTTKTKDTDKQDSTVSKPSNDRQLTLTKSKPTDKQDVAKTSDRTKINTETLAETKPLNRSLDKPVNEPGKKTTTNPTKTSKDDQNPLLDVPDDGKADKGAKIDDDSKPPANLLNGRTKPVRRRRQKPPNLTRTKAAARNMTHREFEESPNVLEVPISTSHNHSHSHSRDHGSSHDTQAHTHKSRTHHGKVKLTKSAAQNKQDQPKE